MGSQVMEIVLWLWSLAIVSVFLSLLFNILRGMFDGYMDRWGEKYLTNDNPGEENNEWEDDPDVLDFLERADEQGPWDEQYDKSYTIGGLSADKDRSFIEFQNKMDERDKQLRGDSDNNNDDEKEE